MFGPLRAARGGRELDLGGPKERRVLAVLVASGGDVVTVDELIEALWGDDPPRTAERSVHAYIARLRKALEPSRHRGAPPRVLVTEGRGYRFSIVGDALDSADFERLTNVARDDLAAGHALRARRALEEGLALWRGTPFDDHLDAPRCAQETHRLEEVEHLAAEELTTARLALGDAAELVPELEALVAENPLRERLWANLMVALYRAGRQADALRTFQRARDVLVEELGVEPGPELRHLEAAILEHDPSLLTSSPGAAPPSRQLPAALDPGGTVLVGRDRELALLRAAWSARSPAGASSSQLSAPMVSARPGSSPSSRSRHRMSARSCCTRVAMQLTVALKLRSTARCVEQVRNSLTCRAIREAHPAPRSRDSSRRGAAAALSFWRSMTSTSPTRPPSRHSPTWRSGRPARRCSSWRRSVRTTRAVVRRAPAVSCCDRFHRAAVREIADLYRPQWTDAEIEELLAASDGVPLAVHRVASEWAQETTRKQVHAAAERATEARVRARRDARRSR